MTPRPLSIVFAGDTPRIDLDLGTIGRDAVRKAEHFWAGRPDVSSPREVSFRRISDAWNNPVRVRQVVDQLSPEQRVVLGVVKRYGGLISGVLLQYELLHRGVIRLRERHGFFDSSLAPRQHDPVHTLCDSLVLIKRIEYGSFYARTREYPDVRLPDFIAAHVESVPPLTWCLPSPPTASFGQPPHVVSRSSAQVTMDIVLLMRTLDGLGSWKLNKGGALPSTIRNKLAKLYPAPGGDPFEPPDRAVLYYQLLWKIRAIRDLGEGQTLDRAIADRMLSLQAHEMVRELIGAWLGACRWCDGQGAVPYDLASERVEQGRNLLAWILTRLAHSKDNQWVDLESFLLDLRTLFANEGSLEHLFGNFWTPPLASLKTKEDLGGVGPLLGYWMRQQGVWFSNALLCTLVHLGVVERGKWDTDEGERWCFRLTPIGQAVFGAPETIYEPPTSTVECLVVQPNHDVLLYLDAADGDAITMLATIAVRDSSEGHVHTFKLTRESVCRALEAGRTIADIESFLHTRSRNDVPANVAQSLLEWQRKRDAIVVRRGVAIHFTTPDRASRTKNPQTSFAILAPDAALQLARAQRTRMEPMTAPKEWKVDEHGGVLCRSGLSLLGKARLQRIARIEKDGVCRVGAATVHAATLVGLSADKIIGWLAASATDDLPPVIVVAIRNWCSGPNRVYLGNAVLLQVPDPQVARALATSARLRPLLQGAIGTGSFVIQESAIKEASKVLRDLGFALDGTLTVRPTIDAGKDREGALATADRIGLGNRRGA